MKSFRKITRFLRGPASSIRPIESAGPLLSLESNDTGDGGSAVSPLPDSKGDIAPPFFKKLKDHLSTHFSHTRNLEKVVDANSKRQGLFLREVDAAIIANLSQEKFDTKALGRAVALSRSQLYRRLKPLVQQSPAHYIQMVRLQKAKSLLEQTDLLIGEIAYQTGFASQSHFTRTFRRHFGYNPSELRNQHQPGLPGN